MVKTTILPEKSTLKWLKVGNGEISRFGIDSNKKIARKSENSKGKKLSKSQKSAKSEKKSSKSENSYNFGTTEAKSKFLTPNTKTAFNRLWLAFTKTRIL